MNQAPAIDSRKTFFAPNILGMQFPTHAQWEKAWTEWIYAYYDGNVSKAAHTGGKSRAAFYRLMAKHGVGQTRQYAKIPD